MELIALTSSLSSPGENCVFQAETSAHTFNFRIASILAAGSSWCSALSQQDLSSHYHHFHLESIRRCKGLQLAGDSPFTVTPESKIGTLHEDEQQSSWSGCLSTTLQYPHIMACFSEYYMQGPGMVPSPDFNILGLTRYDSILWHECYQTPSLPDS